MMQAAQALLRIDRSQGLGGTDAQRILRDDWQTLYDEKIGVTPPPDLSGMWKAQLGLWTEPLHAQWFTRLTGLPTVEPRPFYQHSELPWMFCHLDRWVLGGLVGMALELKHTYGGADLRTCCRYYSAQLTHQMLVLDSEQMWFSMIAGNEEPRACHIELDRDFADRLLDLEHQFWWCVENRERPERTPREQQDAALALVPTIRVGGMRGYDMTGSNRWAEEAGSYLATLEAHKTHERAEKALKELVPEDGETASGHGVMVKRDRRGRMTVKLTG